MLQHFMGMYLIRLTVAERQGQNIKIPDNVRLVISITIQRHQTCSFAAAIQRQPLGMV